MQLQIQTQGGEYIKATASETGLTLRETSVLRSKYKFTNTNKHKETQTNRKKQIQTQHK